MSKGQNSIVSYIKFLVKVRIVGFLRSAFLKFFPAKVNVSGWENRILIINLEALGDLTMFTSVLKHYKRRFPDKKIYLLIKSNFGIEKIFAGKFADEIVVMDYRRFAVNPLYGAYIINNLRRIGFKKVINQDLNGSEIFGKIIGVSLGAEETVSYEGAYYQFRTPFDVQQKKILEVFKKSVLPRYTKIIPAIDKDAVSAPFLSHIKHYAAIYEGATGFIEKDYATEITPVLGKEDVGKFLKKFGLDEKRYAIVNINAGFPNRYWPMERFAKIAEFLEREKIAVVLVGAPNEVERVKKMEEICSVPVVNVAGKTGLPELLALIANAFLVVTNDTSLTHLAVAEKTPSVTIIGGGHFGMLSDYGYKDINKWVYVKMGCFGDNWRCANNVPFGQPSPCVAAVTTEMVLRSVSELIDYLRQSEVYPRNNFQTSFAQTSHFR